MRTAEADAPVSQTVEETNALRLKLGLKPLENENTNTAEPAQSEEKKKSSAEILHRIEESRGKRLREGLIRNNAFIIDEAEKAGDLNLWARKVKRSLIKRNLGSAVEEEVDVANVFLKKSYLPNIDSNEENSELYVAHKMKDIQIKPGDSLTLTLQDSSIINESGELADSMDILENEELASLSKIDKRRKDHASRTQHHTYNSLRTDEEDQNDDDVFYDSLLLPVKSDKKQKTRNILAHYDEWALENRNAKLDKATKLSKCIKLSTLAGKTEKVNPDPGIPTVSLLSNARIQRDVMTKEEAFELLNRKKRSLCGSSRKKRKIVRGEKLYFKSNTNQQLKETEDTDDAEDQDLNILHKFIVPDRKRNILQATTMEDGYIRSESIQARLEQSKRIVKVEQPSVQGAFQLLSLSKVKTKNDEGPDDFLMSGTESVGLIDIKPEFIDSKSALEFSSTTEFCRALQTPVERLEETRKIEISNERTRITSMDTKARPSIKKEISSTVLAETTVPENGEEELGTEKERTNEKNQEDLVRGILEEEVLSDGICSGLEYLRNKGELSDDLWRSNRKNTENAPLHVSTNPNDVKIEYKDDYGRVMTSKEAFRYISWVFHGKGPGKKKKEKMIRKMELEKKMRSMAGNQNQFPTMKALSKQQKKGEAHVVLTSIPSNTPLS